MHLRLQPRTNQEAKTVPLYNDTPANLLLGLGCLRFFDFDANSTLEETPHCTFSPQPNQLLINGSLQLDPYGPRGIEIMYCIATALGGEFEQISNVVTADQVDEVMVTR